MWKVRLVVVAMLLWLSGLHIFGASVFPDDYICGTDICVQSSPDYPGDWLDVRDTNGNLLGAMAVPNNRGFLYNATFGNEAVYYNGQVTIINPGQVSTQMPTLPTIEFFCGLSQVGVDAGPTLSTAIAGCNFNTNLGFYEVIQQECVFYGHYYWMNLGHSTSFWYWDCGSDQPEGGFTIELRSGDISQIHAGCIVALEPNRPDGTIPGKHASLCLLEDSGLLEFLVWDHNLPDNANPLHYVTFAPDACEAGQANRPCHSFGGFHVYRLLNREAGHLEYQIQNANLEAQILPIYCAVDTEGHLDSTDCGHGSWYEP